MKKTVMMLLLIILLANPSFARGLGGIGEGSHVVTDSSRGLKEILKGENAKAGDTLLVPFKRARFVCDFSKAIVMNQKTEMVQCVYMGYVR